MVATDEELMAAYVAGDSAAFEQLFRRYTPLLRRVLSSGLPFATDADDLVQQTFLQVHRARHDFNHTLRLRPWIFTIALNIRRESFRSWKRRPTTPFDETAGNVPVRGNPEDHTDAARVLLGPLGRLPSDQREVIALHWFAGMTFPEIATVVGATTGAVKLRAHRGYVKLRSLLGVPNADATDRNSEPSPGIQSTTETVSVDRGLR
jgi:RNA polymerase sigma factor (sigma-70 family)